MKEKGLAKGFQKYGVFHERYKFLLILCSVAGLHVRATDRIIKRRWVRILFRIWTSTMHLVLTSIFLSSFVHIFMSIVNKERAAKTVHSITILGCSVHGVFRQYFMHKNINKYDELYQKWDELFGDSDPDWKPRQSAIDICHKKVKKTLLILGVVTCFMITTYSAGNIFAEDKTFRLPTALPYKHQTPDYEIMTSYFTFGIFFHAIAVSSSQMLLLSPIIWELGELNRLQKCIKDILSNSEAYGEEVSTSDGYDVVAKSYTTAGVAAVAKKMKLWITQHQKLAEFHLLSMQLNNFELGMEMLATFIEACGIAIIIATPNYLPPTDLFTLALGFVAYFSLFYYSCAKCNELSDLSMSVVDDAFKENWTALPGPLKKNFQMIIMRTSKPFDFYGAYVFRIDIMAFNQIFQTAYSVFNFFFTVVNG